MSEETGYSLTLRQVEDFEFDAQFDWESVPHLTLDEPEPLGRAQGPNASRLIGAAVGNCLSASLLFCLRKSRVDVTGIETRVTGALQRNERGRLRLGPIDVRITLDTDPEDIKKVTRCLGLYEDFCVVTASIRQAVEVQVAVVDRRGNTLSPSEGANP
jgi:uncharacterized OsmC-like protein